MNEIVLSIKPVLKGLSAGIGFIVGFYEAYECMKFMNGQVNEWVGEWMKGWVSEGMNEWVN